jgi:hypothetical protein
LNMTTQTTNKPKVWCEFYGMVESITELKLTKDTFQDVLEFKVRCHDDESAVILSCRVYGEDAVKLSGDLHRGDYVRMDGRKLAPHWWNPAPGVTKAHITFVPESVNILT